MFHINCFPGYLFFVALMLHGWVGFGQENNTSGTFTIYGRVTNTFSKQGLEAVNISINGTHIGTISDQYGSYSLAIPISVFDLGQPILVFSYVGYATQKLPLDTPEDKKINITLDPEQFLLKEIIITGEPQRVYGNPRYHLWDYELLEDYILFIAYEKRLGQSVLLLTDQQEKLISTHGIPGKPIALIKDCLDDIYLVTQNYYFKVEFENLELSLIIAPQDKFNRIVNSCIDHAGSHFYFEYYFDGYFTRRFYHLDTLLEEPPELIREISDRVSIRRLLDEAAFLDAAHDQSAHAREFARRFSQEIVFQPPYLPIRTIHDTLYLFNHFENQLEILALDGTPLDSHAISYHQEKGWQKQLYKDPISQKCYTSFLRHGITRIALIDEHTGQTTESMKVEHPYIEKVQIHDDYIYFLYRPFESLQRKYLYRKPFGGE